MGNLVYTGAELISASIIARSRKYLHPLSLESVERMCREKTFKTATKLGPGKRAHWYVLSSEVIKYKINRSIQSL